MKKSIFAEKNSRTKLFYVITAAVIIAVLALNFLLTFLTSKSASYLDITAEGLYTPTDAMIEACSFVDELPEGREIKITFCADPDTVMKTTVLRAPYLMAKALERKFEKLTVETVNVATNPTAVAAYKTTALSTISATDIIVSYGNRYRITSANRFWVGDSETGAFTHFDGEYELASILLSLTNRTLPVAYFVSNHGETAYDPTKLDSDGSAESAQLALLLENRGLEVRALDLSTVDKIPDDCSLLIINTPKTDLTVDADKLNSLFEVASEAEMIENYLIAGNGALIVALDYDLRNYPGYAEAEAAGTLDTYEPLPNLKGLLSQWGFKFSSYKVKDTEGAVNGDSSNMLGVYITEENSFGNAVYGDYASSASAPSMIFKNTGYIECAFGLDTVANEYGTSQTFRHFDEFIHTSDKAIGYGYSSVTEGYDDEYTAQGKKALAAITTREYLDPVAAVQTYSFVFCVNSTEFFSNETLADTSYANYDIVSALVTSMIRTDTHASMELGGLSGNSENRLGKALVSDTLVSLPTKTQKALESTDITVYSVIIYAIPVAIGVLGIIMCIRRRFL